MVYENCASSVANHNVKLQLPQPFEDEDCPYAEDLPDDIFRRPRNIGLTENQVAWYSYPFTSKRRELQERLTSLSFKRTDAFDNVDLAFSFANFSSSRHACGGWAGFLVLYDHFQQDLMNVTFRRRTKSDVMQEIGRERMEEEIWGESDDEQGSHYLR